MQIKYFYSPNFNEKQRSFSSIKSLVIHYTGMQSERESLFRLCDPRSKVSCHFIINKNGKICRLIPDNYIAWHAGKSCWGNYKNINENSIGIELVNKGHRFGYENFSKKQILSLIKVCKILIKRYGIKKKNVIGHSDIAPLRKIDPGEKFPWFYLSKKNIGIWHNCRKIFLKKLRRKRVYKKNEKKIFVKNLKKIGYCFSSNKKLIFSKNLKAFQRHFRQELIDGVLDKECMFIAQNLTKKI